MHTTYVIKWHSLNLKTNLKEELEEVMQLIDTNVKKVETG